MSKNIGIFCSPTYW